MLFGDGGLSVGFSTISILLRTSCLDSNNMALTLEDIKEGGASIRVGTTGKIGALVTRELETMNSAPHPVSAPGGVKASKNLKLKGEADEGSCSSTNHISQKTGGSSQKAHRIPMLGSSNIALEGTPTRGKSSRGCYLVEVVDLKCGNAERTWVKPIKKQIKKLSFSKLSET